MSYALIVYTFVMMILILIFFFIKIFSDFSAGFKAHIRRHLSQEARDCGHLVLWFDCDREGDNICFEVVECTGFHRPWSGTDASDHPPIIPMRAVNEDMLVNDAWKLYQYVCQHFIGTVSPDCKYLRNKVQAGRKLVPTALGISLIRGYQCIDLDFCLKNIRSFIEQQITLVAKRQVDHSRMVEHVLQQFKQKFIYFVKQISFLQQQTRKLQNCWIKQRAVHVHQTLTVRIAPLLHASCYTVSRKRWIKVTFIQIVVAKGGLGCATSEYIAVGHMLIYIQPYSYSACMFTYPPDAFLSLMNLHIHFKFGFQNIFH